jgi:hypothetical protein
MIEFWAKSMKCFQIMTYFFNFAETHCELEKGFRYIIQNLCILCLLIFPHQNNCSFTFVPPHKRFSHSSSTWYTSFLSCRYPSDRCSKKPTMDPFLIHLWLFHLFVPFFSELNLKIKGDFLPNVFKLKFCMYHILHTCVHVLLISLSSF